MSLEKSTVQRRKTLVSKTALKFPFGESAICPTIRNQLLMSWMILIFCLIEHSQTSPPQNLATVKGTKVRLNCSRETFSLLSWSFYNYSRGSQTERENIGFLSDVTTGYEDRFSIDVPTQHDMDLIFTAYENASGLFACRKDAEDELRETAHVIVLDPRPTCSKTKTEDGSVRVDCSIGFSGFWPPGLEWLKADVKLETDNTTTTNTVTSSHLVKLKPSTSYDLTCTPKFTLENKPEAKLFHKDAENIPEFPNSCTMTIDKSDKLFETSSPQNLAVVDGTKVRLNCSVKPGTELRWFMFNLSGTNPTENELLSTGNVKDNSVTCSACFSIDDSTKGNLDLLITASKTASGIYACQNEQSADDYSAHIIVLDPGPTCSKTKTEERYTRLECSIGFSGYWSPELEWLKADVKLETNNTNTTNKVTSSHLVKLKPSTPYDLTCTPKFTLKNKPKAKRNHKDAENIPEFPNSCTMTIEKSDGKNERTNGTQKEPPKGPLIGDPIDKDKDIGDFPTSATFSIHDWHNLHLNLSLTTLVVIGMLHKWLWQ